jgi:hypothetical protein
MPATPMSHRGRVRVARIVALAMAAAGAAGAAACVDHLPEQDLRILTAVPAAKLSVDLLVKEFKDDAAGATKRYKGNAVELTGHASASSPGDLNAKPPVHGSVTFTVDAMTVAASVLDEQNAKVTTAAKDEPRVTLRCFVEGLQATQLILRSCIQP